MFLNIKIGNPLIGQFTDALTIVYTVGSGIKYSNLQDSHLNLFNFNPREYMRQLEINFMILWHFIHSVLI
ncbi:MAG: hypothetical protein ACFFAN_01460 [Promethearchaeota archaeon]